MSFGFLGIQFGFGLQNANVSRIFQTLGADMEDIPILWVAAPLTGLIVQPIIGHFSDKTWSDRWGRRRPYFMAGAILASLALFIMPNSPILWVAAGMLWIMDASINISMEPFRAFVGDLLPSEQRTQGFAMQTFFIGVGAVIASALPYILANWFGLSDQAPEGGVPDQVKYSFYIGGVVFLASVLWTVFSSKEYTPEEVAQFEAAEPKGPGEGSPVPHSLVAPRTYYRNSILFVLAGVMATWWVMNNDGNKELYIVTVGLIAFGLFQLVSGILASRNQQENGFMEIMNDMLTMPSTMAQLAFVQFFSWFALFSMWIYTTGAVTESVFGTTDTKSAIYNQGADWVGVCFAVYNGIAAVFAFALPALAKRTSRKFVHALSLVCGGIGLASIYFVTDQYMLLVSMVGVGIGWAGILSMPYAILSGALPQQKMGVYMGIFNFFIVIPQLVAASILGYLISTLFDDRAIYALLIGGISMVIAAALVYFVRDVDEEKLKSIQS